MQISAEFKIWFPALEPSFSQDELHDAFEIHVFEFKIVLCNSIAIKALFEAKTKRFEKILSAYNSASNIKIELTSASYDSSEIFEFSENMLEAIDSYFLERNKLLFTIRSVETCMDLAIHGNKLCQLEKNFSANWKSNEIVKSDVVMSKIPDPMEIRKAIQNMQKLKIFTFTELSNQEIISDIVIKTELYRRILISNYGK